MTNQRPSTKKLHLLSIPAWLGLTLALALLTLTLPPLAWADGGITVNTTADEYDIGSNCSLREAIQSANTDSDFGGCTRSGTAPYTITVPAGVYTLTIVSTNEDDNANGDLDLRASMTIEGAGADQTIIQAGPDTVSGIDRVFHIPVSGLTVELSGLTIRHGNDDDGGGIFHWGDGTLTITNCAITDNEAASQAGGLCAAGGTVTINNSTISGNTSGTSGGGLAVPGGGGTLNVNNCTISGNTANNFGGGGIRHQDGILRVTSSTIYGNTANGHDGGGIRTTPAITPSIKNTIIASNTAGVSGPDCHGTINSGGYNLIQNAANCGGTVGTDITGQDPKLGPLANNGGGTETHALLTGSPAIDYVPVISCTISTDQRGVPRPQPPGRDCDVGAFEATPDLHLTKTVTPTGPIYPGTSITYTLTFSNTGAITATGVVITDAVPVGVINTSVVSSGVAITQRVGTRYVWDVADLAYGAGGVITITGVIRDPLPAGTFTNTAVITTTAVDDDTGNNSDSASVTVILPIGGHTGTVSPLALLWPPCPELAEGWIALVVAVATGAGVAALLKRRTA